MFSMVHTAAMASEATPFTVVSEVFTAVPSKVPLATLDPALSYLWAWEVPEERAVLAERARGEVDQAPAAVPVLHRGRRKRYVS